MTRRYGTSERCETPGDRPSRVKRPGPSSASTALPARYVSDPVGRRVAPALTHLCHQLGDSSTDFFDNSFFDNPENQEEHMWRRWRAAVRGCRDRGMTTAEYAVGTLAACALAAVLYKVVTSAAVQTALRSVIERALHAQF